MVVAVPRPPRLLDPGNAPPGPHGSLAQPLSEEERTAVLQALAEVVREVGVERVLTRPVVLPDERHFPDGWDGSLRGVARLLRRLMRFAQMDLCPLLVSPRELVSTRLTNAWLSNTTHTNASAVVLAGTTSDGMDGAAALAFAVDLRHLDDPDAVVGACAREVARAFRVLRGCADADPDMEERRVDLTAVALGFGVLVANPAHRVTSLGALMGNVTWSEHTRTEAGALSPRALSLALGALVAARGLDEGRIRAALETNQAAWFAEACRELRDSAAPRLGLPASAAAPAAIAMEELLGPLVDEGLLIDEPAPAAFGARALDNAGRPVFCVRRRRTWPGAGVGLAGGLLAALGTVSLGGPLALPLWLLAGGVATGLGVGASLRSWACASCEARLPDVAPDPVGQTCPGCGGTVVGRVAHRDQRLAAEEEWRRAART